MRGVVAGDTEDARWTMLGDVWTASLLAGNAQLSSVGHAAVAKASLRGLLAAPPLSSIQPPHKDPCASSNDILFLKSHVPIQGKSFDF